MIKEDKVSFSLYFQEDFGPPAKKTKPSQPRQQTQGPQSDDVSITLICLSKYYYSQSMIKSSEKNNQ